MGHAGEGQRRAKRDTFSTSDRDQLAAIALALPDDWVAVVETSGQVAVMPRHEVHHVRAAAVADPVSRRISVRRWHFATGSAW
jgi:hypothetical protein